MYKLDLALIPYNGWSATKPNQTKPSVPTTTGITVTSVSQNFFSLQANSRYLSIYLLSFIFPLSSAGTEKSTIKQVLFFLVN